jgi:hypothetical protein
MNVLRRTMPFLLAVFCIAALAPSASAGTDVRHAAASPGRPAIVGDLAAYLWSEAEPLYDFDGQLGAITVTRSSAGQYEVDLPNLSAVTGGMVQVTPYDSKDTCAVGGWGPSESDLLVYVSCYSLRGHPADSLFDLIVTQPVTAPPGAFDYSWVYQDARSATLTGQYQYNSANKSNLVRHLGKGRYEVTFSGPASKGTRGTVKVSAYGSGAGDCAASGWHGTSKGVVVDVNCYTSSGKPVNREFDVTYANRTNLMGLADFPTANALVTAAGKVQTQYDSAHTAHVTVVHHRRGLYRVQLVGTTEAAGGGDIQVSPVTGSKDHCTVVDWQGGTNVKTVATVQCFDRHGHSVNSAFTLQFVVAFLT